MDKLFFNLEDIPNRLVYKDTKKVKPDWNLKQPGQYKLLLSEIRFLTMEACIQNFPKDTQFTILYIGSGKGFHIPTLIKMYSGYKINWVLFDPNGHCETLVENESLKINNKFFTKDDVEFYKKVPNLLFISDIRTTNSTNNVFVDDSPTTKNLLDDYELQNHFLRELKPMFSYLKFRMPFPTDWDDSYSFEKPNGKNCLQCFQPQTSTEFRIFTSGIPTFQKIDNKEILIETEEKFHWFNTLYRKSSEFDKKMSYFIIRRYFDVEKINTVLTEGDIFNYLRNLKF